MVQGLLPNDRLFDPFDILANVVGSVGAIGICGWYHRRMLERRRQVRFGSLSDDIGEPHDDDIELGLSGSESHHLHEDTGPQETGVITNLEREVENWDENAVDNWDTEDGPGPDEENGNAKTRND